MENVAVLNALSISPYAFKKLDNTQTALDRALAYAESLPDVKSIIVLSDNGNLDGLKLHEKTEVFEPNVTTMKDLIRVLSEKTSEFTTVFYYYADCPLIDLELTRRMYENHKKYFAQYTFADGYPYGLAPEIINPSIFQSLSVLAENDDSPVTRDGVFSVLQKDINAFDVETEISPEDLRLLRVSLSCDTKRNFTQTRSIIEAGGLDEATITRVLREQGELLRTFPAYIAIQITDGCLQECSYCPFPGFGGSVLENRGEMEVEKVKNILEKVHRFSEDAVICPSLWGEPGRHSDFTSIYEAVMSCTSFSCLIETSGLGWTEETLMELRSITDRHDPEMKRIDWIVSLDALDADLYGKLRGSGKDEAERFCHLAATHFPGRVHAQAVRMKSNEENLERFYRHWKEQLGNVIIQKYDHFCGLLDQRKVTDLSPLKRFACWHLKRDISVLIDGTVPLCREDVNRKHVLGNIFEDSLETIWEKGDEYYRKHLDERYPDICKQCDEYYTYNF